MDIELLRTFLEVHRTRHFGRAARNLFISQSAVSARIKQLEDTLGVPVLTRERNNIRLTPGGQRLLPHAERLVNTWTRARQVIHMAEGSETALTLGATAGVWEAGLRARMPALCDCLGEALIAVESHDSETLLRRLLDGGVDLALMFQPPRLRGVLTRPLCAVTLVMVSDRPDRSFPEALAAGFVAVDWPGVQPLDPASEEDIPPPRLRFTLASMAHEHLLRCGGSAYLEASTVAADLAAGRLFEVADAPPLERQVLAVFVEGTDKVATIDRATALLSAAPEAAEQV